MSLQNNLSKKPPSYQVSKWLTHRALLSPEELQHLFSYLGACQIYRVGKVFTQHELETKVEEFLSLYRSYWDTLFYEGRVDLGAFLFTNDEKFVQFDEVAPGRYITRPYKPLIQVRAHTFLVTHDGRLQSMTYSADSIRFGLEFAYPQLFVNPTTHRVEEIRKESHYTNTLLFQSLGKWMRANTKPTPLNVQGNRINATFRIGKESIGFLKGHRDFLREKVKLWESE